MEKSNVSAYLSCPSLWTRNLARLGYLASGRFYFLLLGSIQSLPAQLSVEWTRDAAALGIAIGGCVAGPMECFCRNPAAVRTAFLVWPTCIALYISLPVTRRALMRPRIVLYKRPFEHSSASLADMWRLDSESAGPAQPGDAQPGVPLTVDRKG